LQVSFARAAGACHSARRQAINVLRPGRPVGFRRRGPSRSSMPTPQGWPGPFRSTAPDENISGVVLEPWQQAIVSSIPSEFPSRVCRVRRLPDIGRIVAGRNYPRTLSRITRRISCDYSSGRADCSGCVHAGRIG